MKYKCCSRVKEKHRSNVTGEEKNVIEAYSLCKPLDNHGVINVARWESKLLVDSFLSKENYNPWSGPSNGERGEKRATHIDYG
jgi:hypothetical protein